MAQCAGVDRLAAPRCEAEEGAWWKPPEVEPAPPPGLLQTLTASIVVPLILVLLTVSAPFVLDAEAFVTRLMPVPLQRYLRQVPLTWSLFSAYEFAVAGLAAAILKPSLVWEFMAEDGVSQHSYGPASAQQLLLFEPPRRGEAPPLVVFVHGGVWCHSRYWMYRLVGRRLRAMGFAVAVVGYGQYPSSSVPGMVRDLRASLAWLRGHCPKIGIDGSRIALLGHSSGGHLCALLALAGEAQHLASVATLSAPFDVEMHYGFEKGRGVAEISALYPANGGQARLPELSVPQILDSLAGRSDLARLPRLFVAHGADDSTVPAEQATRFAAKLNDVAGLRVEPVLWPGQGHIFVLAALMGLPVTAGAEAAMRDVVAFLQESLQLKRPASDIPN